VRSSAGQTLGQIGQRQLLPAAVPRALQEVVLTESDDVTRSATINAPGQAATRSACPEAAVMRIAGIFGESHLSWMYARAAEALGRIGTAQPLPGAVFDQLNTVFSTTKVPGLREELSRAFATISRGQRLPDATLELFADSLDHERNKRIRVQAVYALAHAGADYPRARELIMAAREDADREVRNAAAGGLSIMDANALYAGREPLLQLAGWLWAATLFYAVTGWGLHYPVRCQLSSTRYLRVSATITPLRPIRPMRLGMAISPFMMSAKSQTIWSLSNAPQKTAITQR
jgi:HEAT repeat protein